MKIHALLVLFSPVFCIVSTCEYQTFDNTRVQISSKLPQYTKEYATIIVNGCIDQNNTASKDAETIKVMGRVPALNKSALQNLPKLRYLSFRQCDLAHIKPGALVNLTELFHLDLSSNRLAYLENDVFKGLHFRTLNLSKNSISYIEDGALHVDSVRNLLLDHNVLEEISAKWFTTTNIDEISLSNNLIEHIPAYTFSHIRNMGIVNLSHNRIADIHPDAFNGSLYYVDVSYNKIKTLHDNLFRTAVVEVLSLNNNRLTFLSRKFLNNLRGSLYLDIFSNPWECSCYEDLLKWTRKEGVEVNQFLKKCHEDVTLVCVTGLHSSPGECNEVVDEELYTVYNKNALPVHCTSS